MGTAASSCAGGMGKAARQECPEGQGRALDEEERREFLRLQEPSRRGHKLIRKWGATDAAVHDSQKLDDVLDLSNTGQGGLGGQRLRSVQIEAGLEEKGLQSRIHRRAARNRPLTERQKSANTTRSKVRAVSSTYSATSRARWAARSCAPSASRGRGSRSG